MSVRAAVAHRLADDAAVDLVFPQSLSGARGDRLEPTIHAAVEHQPARRSHSPRPDGEVFLHDPGGSSLNRIPGGELTTVSPRTWLHVNVRAYVRSAYDVVHLH